MSDDELLDIYLKKSSTQRDNQSRGLFAELKSRGLVSRYNQVSVMIREFETEVSGPHRSSWLKLNYDSGTINEKTLVLVDDLLGEGKPGWLLLREVFELRLWLPRNISVTMRDFKSGKRVSSNRLEPRPIAGLADMGLIYPTIINAGALISDRSLKLAPLTPRSEVGRSTDG